MILHRLWFVILVHCCNCWTTKSAECRDLLPCILCGSLSRSRHMALESGFVAWFGGVRSLSALESHEGTNLICSKTLASSLCGRSRCTTLTGCTFYSCLARHGRSTRYFQVKPLHSRCLQRPAILTFRHLQHPCHLQRASFPGHSQIAVETETRVFNSCEIKFGSGLGTRLAGRRAA